eukprot:2210186-Alexandrium_andersonii.AAC.1
MRASPGNPRLGACSRGSRLGAGEPERLADVGPDGGRPPESAGTAPVYAAPVLDGAGWSWPVAAG